MSTKTEIIYNGACPICAREVAAYRRYSDARSLDLTFTPLSQADLDGLGLTADAAARRLHVVHGGRLVAGVEAFALLWDAMPRFRPLARIVRLPLLRGPAEIVYERLLAPLLYGLHRRRERRALRSGLAPRRSAE